MKLFITFTSLIVVIIAASDQDLWVEFKTNFTKTYKSSREEKLRFNIFQQKLREIESHNAEYEKGKVSYFLRVNKFSDLTEKEFVEMLNKNHATIPEFRTIPFEKIKHAVNNEITLGKPINWVEEGAVSPVRDQGECGSSWAFSVAGSIEGQNFIKNNRTGQLSVQQLLDCTKENDGCNKGDMKYGFTYAKNHGLSYESDYPYRGKCENIEPAIKIKDFVELGVESGEIGLLHAVGAVGPISVSLNAELWQSYGGGIYNNFQCKNYSLTHDVLVVGFDISLRKYWIIKNSWGESWGENGYMRLIRQNSNVCGIGKRSIYPVL